MELFWTSGILILAVVNVAFLIVLLALARQLGVLLVRLGPVRPKAVPTDVHVGDRVERIAMTDMTGLTHVIEPSKSTNHLLVFILPGCPACQDVLPGLRTLAAAYRPYVRIFVISGGQQVLQDAQYARQLQPQVSYVCDATLHERFGIQATPYAMLLDSDNEIVSQGIVNNLEHLESLFAIELFTLRQHDQSPVSPSSALVTLSTQE